MYFIQIEYSIVINDSALVMFTIFRYSFEYVNCGVLFVECFQKISTNLYYLKHFSNFFVV